MLKTSLGCFENLSHSPRDTAPSLGLGFEWFPSRLGQAVVFAAAVVLGASPIGGNPTFFLHSVEGGQERDGLNKKSAASNLLDSARDFQSMYCASHKLFQDQQVESRLQKGRRFRIQNVSPIGILSE